MQNQNLKSSNTDAVLTDAHAPGTRCSLSVSDFQKHELDETESGAAVRQIMTAFVEVGFGISAVQQARTASNNDRILQALAERFCQDAA